MPHTQESNAMQTAPVLPALLHATILWSYRHNHTWVRSGGSRTRYCGHCHMVLWALPRGVVGTATWSKCDTESMHTTHSTQQKLHQQSQQSKHAAPQTSASPAPHAVTQSKKAVPQTSASPALPARRLQQTCGLLPPERHCAWHVQAQVPAVCGQTLTPAGLTQPA